MKGGRPATDETERLAHWVREHGRAVYGYLVSVTRNRHAADDLLQDVFCRAWEARHRYVDNGHERPTYCGLPIDWLATEPAALITRRDDAKHCWTAIVGKLSSRSTRANRTTACSSTNVRDS